MGPTSLKTTFPDTGNIEPISNSAVQFGGYCEKNESGLGSSWHDNK